MLGHLILNNAIAMKGTADNADLLDRVLEAMVREHARFVYRLTYSILRNREDAEDATQEVFIRLLRYKKKLPEVRDHKVWLARIAWRVAIDGKAKRRRVSNTDTSVDLLEMPAMGPGVEQLAASRQITSLLERMIATLPPELRDTLTLSTVRDLNSAEIAEILGIPEGTVRTRLMRARNLLKQKLIAMEGQHV